MNYFEILPSRKIPQILLTYKIDKPLKIGQVVEISIRNKLVLGVVWSQNTGQIDLQEDKIKEITRVLPLILNTNQIEFLKLFTQNTFNSANFAIESFLQPFQLLTKKQLKELEMIQKEDKIKTLNSQLSPNIKEKEAETNFFLENDISFRIRYIIRSIINSLEKNKLSFSSKDLMNILIVFPEKKILDKFFNENAQIIQKENSENSFILLLNRYLGDVSKSSKTTLKDILYTSYNNIDNLQHINLIFATRSSLFLPFPNIENIILVDESSTMYIQEQNKLYYDAREVAFLLSKVYKCSLNFVSRIPSIRLYNFYPEKILESFLSNNKIRMQKPLKIEISKRDARFDEFDVISDRLEQEFSPQDYQEITEHP